MKKFTVLTSAQAFDFGTDRWPTDRWPKGRGDGTRTNSAETPTRVGAKESDPSLNHRTNTGPARTPHALATKARACAPARRNHRALPDRRRHRPEVQGEEGDRDSEEGVTERQQTLVRLGRRLDAGQSHRLGRHALSVGH